MRPSPLPDDTARATRATWAAGLWTLLTLLAAFNWWQDARPVSIAAAAPGPLPCVSYAPSQGAGRDREPLTVERIRHDLQVLARRTACVRTYTVAEGHDLVPGVAQELGMQVLLGLWIGADAAHNRRELARGIAVARQHRPAVRAIVVGNEVLLRGELTPAQLATLLRRVARATELPVTYADVWGRWLDHPELAHDVAFVTVHVLPYWNDDPVGIDQVIDDVDTLVADLQHRFEGKPLFIGETGWPSAGRPRGPAVPGRVEQARYLREFTTLAARRGLDFNVIEAFDQPWKIPHEGTVGGHWGLHDARARAKFAWTGPVAEAPQGLAVAWLTLVLGALTASVVVVRGRGHARSSLLRQGLVAFALAGSAVAIGARQWRYLVDGNVSVVDWTATVAIALVGWLALVRTARALAAPRGGPAPDPIPRGVALVLLAGAAYVGLGLVFAGRHRDFPVWLFLPAALAFVLSALADPDARGRALHLRRGHDEVVLACWLVVAGGLVAAMERFANALSVGWGSASVLLGLAVLVPWILMAREEHRTGDHAGPGPGEVVQHHPDDAARHGHVRERPRSPP